MSACGVRWEWMHSKLNSFRLHLLFKTIQRYSWVCYPRKVVNRDLWVPKCQTFPLKLNATWIAVRWKCSKSFENENSATTCTALTFLGRTAVLLSHTYVYMYSKSICLHIPCSDRVKSDACDGFAYFNSRYRGHTTLLEKHYRPSINQTQAQYSLKLASSLSAV